SLTSTRSPALSETLSTVCSPDSTMLLPVVAARTAVLIAMPAFGVDDDGASVALTVAPRRSSTDMRPPFQIQIFVRPLANYSGEARLPVSQSSVFAGDSQ